MGLEPPPQLLPLSGAQPEPGSLPSGNSDSNWDLLRRLWNFLTPDRKWQVRGLGLLMLCGTFLEMLSIGSVLPFLSTLMDPSAALRQPTVARFAGLVGITAPDQLLAPLTAVFIGIVGVSAIFRLSLIWGTHRMSYLLGSDVSTEVYRRTLYQPYSVHVSRNSSHLITSITKKVSHVTHVFQTLLTALTSAVLALGIVAALLLVDPLVASLAALVFSGGYLLVAKVTRRRLLRNAKRIKETSVLLVKALQEGLGGIRDVLLDGTQVLHCAEYRKVDRPTRAAIASNGFIALTPRVAMEAFAISGVAGLAYALTQRAEGIGGFLPVLGVLALGAQRLLPSFQNIYAAYASFMGQRTSLVEIVELLEQPLPEYALEPAPPPLAFQQDLRFENVSFRYPGTDTWVLSGVSFTIEKGKRVGFVGKTGGGKSTALDLLMGLLEPTMGRIVVDGQTISGSHLRAWQQSLAHVPQSIFLSDSSMAENIAFGVRPGKIDMERVRRAADIAAIGDFIASQPQGYQSAVGERGVRLSGGQRQRIGIARALYKNAQVLILDEATSALDNATERHLVDAIDAMSRDLTVLMIAHRLTTVERCDKILVLDSGKVVAEGDYATLLKESDIFRSLVSQDAN